MSAPVFASLVGQEAAVAILEQAARQARDPALVGKLTRSWLLTGPAGSGRSVAATAFAAALQCTAALPGCGECAACRTVLAGTHADVVLVRPEGLSITVAEARAVVAKAARAPSTGHWRVVLIEDADRLVKVGNEAAANALLKAVEEPADRTVFLLCAPSTEDVLPTIRSRCRLVGLRTPANADVAGVLIAEGVDGARAHWAAAAAQGHVGRARRLAVDEGARLRRTEVLRLPTRIRTVAGALAAAADLVEATAEEATASQAGRNANEKAAVESAWGAAVEGSRKKAPGRGAAGALKDLEKDQKSRGTRATRDALDRALVDLAAFYRDALVIQLGAAATPTHADVTSKAAELARGTLPEATVRRIEAVLRCREKIALNVAPLVAVEAMALELRDG